MLFGRMPVCPQGVDGFLGIEFVTGGDGFGIGWIGVASLGSEAADTPLGGSAVDAGEFEGGKAWG